jgi:phage shock protein E
MHKSKVSLIRAVLAGVTAIALAVGVAGCATQSIDAKSATAIIDVRTADEFNQGHLQGAVNIDVEQPSFQNQVTMLDKNGSYIVYCHSGRRAGIAMDEMTQLGFKHVVNAGGIDQAAQSTGLAVVNN